jgi:hypothetical protein
MTWADFVVRGTLVLAAGFAASFALGRASAALRHLIWTAAFGALLVLPVVLQMAPKVAVAIPQKHAPASGRWQAEARLTIAGTRVAFGGACF